MRIYDRLVDRGVRPGSTRRRELRSKIGQRPRDGKESSRAVPRHGSGPRCIGLGSRELVVLRTTDERKPMTAFREVLHGEFDPGSGRTLAACLTHASGATNQGLPWGRAANG